jgi:hypothetical protein
MMAKLYQQFLGTRPGIVVELIDDATSPCTVRTEEGFEFSISAEDFRNYYRQLGDNTPKKWGHLITSSESGFVDSGTMASVMGIVRTFEYAFQDFGKARAFVRDAMRVVEEDPSTDVNKLKSWLLESSYSHVPISDDDLKCLTDAEDEVRVLLLGEDCAVLRLPIGANEDEPYLGEGTAEGGKTVKKPAKSTRKTASKPRRAGMKNAEMQVDGDTLTITVDLSKELGPSKSGKTTIVATSEGNKSIPGREEKIGLNIYKQETKKPAKGRRASFKNVEMAVTGDMLTITVDLSKELGPSKSGKTIIVASTGGNQLVLGHEAKIGLNVYKKID